MSKFSPKLDLPVGADQSGALVSFQNCFLHLPDTYCNPGIKSTGPTNTEFLREIPKMFRVNRELPKIFLSATANWLYSKWFSYNKSTKPHLRCHFNCRLLARGRRRRARGSSPRTWGNHPSTGYSRRGSPHHSFRIFHLLDASPPPRLHCWHPPCWRPTGGRQGDSLSLPAASVDLVLLDENSLSYELFQHGSSSHFQIWKYSHIGCT